MPELALDVEGTVLRGFETAEVTASMDAFASSFQFDYFANILEGGAAAIIARGDAARVDVGDETLLNGWVWATETGNEGGGQKKLDRVVRGYSKLGDLTKCSAFNGRRRFRDISLIDLATELTQPYGIAIYDRTQNIEPLERWALTEGSTIADELTRAAKARGVVFLDEAGDLVIAPAGEFSTQTVIRETNRLDGRVIYDDTERFSEYVVKSKRRRRNEDEGTEVVFETTVEDAGVRRFLRHIVQPFGEKASDVSKRAQLERNVRAGRSERAIIEMPGWLNDEGVLWRPNTRVRVEDVALDIEATLLVESATLIHDTDRRRTRLQLTRPEAFDAVVDYPTRRRGDRWE